MLIGGCCHITVRYNSIPGTVKVCIVALFLPFILLLSFVSLLSTLVNLWASSLGPFTKKQVMQAGLQLGWGTSTTVVSKLYFPLLMWLKVQGILLLLRDLAVTTDHFTILCFLLISLWRAAPGLITMQMVWRQIKKYFEQTRMNENILHWIVSL